MNLENLENKWEKATEKELKKEWGNITRKNLLKNHQKCEKTI